MGDEAIRLVRIAEETAHIQPVPTVTG